MRTVLILGLVIVFFPVHIFASQHNEKNSKIIISPITLLYPDSLMPYTMDGSWATVRNPNGTITFFETAMAHKPYYYRHTGTYNNPLKTAIAPFQWDYNGYNNQWSSGNWIQNIYKHTNDTLIGLVHREDLYPANKDPYKRSRFFIGLARSFDGGNNWKYLGDVLGNAANSLKSEGKPNMGGVPALIVGKYLYLYFNEIYSNEQKAISVARAKLVDVINSIRTDKVCRFVKFNKGKWSEDGMTGSGSQIIPGYQNGYDAHSDAAYCKPLHKYLLTIQTHATIGTLLLYQSTDGVHWESNPIILDNCPGMMHPYSSIVSFDKDASDDSFIVGKNFYIYFVRKKGNNYDYDELYYLKVQIK